MKAVTAVRAALASMVLAGFLAMVVGCGQTGSNGGDQPKGDGTEKPAKVAKKGHDHSGWWCDEHGIPEEECSMCSARAAKAFKAKGDWCDMHDRARSQCFLCDPSLKEKYAAKYRAKYGTEPPPIGEEQDETGAKR